MTLPTPESKPETMAVTTPAATAAAPTSINTEEQEQQADSSIPASSSKKEDHSVTLKKSAPDLRPAPLPTSSPWKFVNQEVPVATISPDSLKTKKNKNQNKNKTVTTNTATSWIPMQAAIVVTDSLKNNNNGKKNSRRKNNNNNSNNRNRRSNNNKAKKTDSKQTMNSDELSKKEDLENISNVTSKNEDNTKEGNVVEDNLIEKSSPAQDDKQNNHNHSHHHRRQQHHNHKKHQHTYTPNTTTPTCDDQSPKLETSTENASEAPSSSATTAQQTQAQNHSHPHPHPHNGHYQKRHYNHNRNNYMNNNNNNGSLKNHNHHQYDQQPMMSGYINVNYPSNQTFDNNGIQRKIHVPTVPMSYPIQPIIQSINDIARTIEYYFSDENLSKDKFLISKLSKNGYVSLYLISKFFRIVKLSFGGDPMIVLAAIREILNNPDATVEIVIVKKNDSNTTDRAEDVEELNSPLSNYFIRAKSEPLKWVPSNVADNTTYDVEIERPLEIEDLNKILFPQGMATNSTGSDVLNTTD
ncbi:Slf1p NDAI_0F04410 [Naumovozyma dairenensis CBS 421]|uniref:HTH La-type RNA-binding domain-containing protein n=1 Tax=Naumovozyma dairenensis (strain ATCC 10597 / BCRC 20456 / CBS 421 / NBRC 0211 / NRRL Y-12639) TaxID=1071378 RepID=G0WD98_NAUDC|nr:hypothetical protein NDAI_0F04410 [Naumovozyma dairenensis CBS 421]CCD25759.1 hypothetical protein NDAI_0F04410 [Naumovozyma dairenensis CBS 421]